jgi:hypothetical protein
VPKPSIVYVRSLKGSTSGNILSRFGAPTHMDGARWTYQVDARRELYLYFDREQVIEVKPDDIPLSDFEKSASVPRE